MSKETAYIEWTDKQLKEAGLKPKEVQAIANGLLRLSERMKKLDLYVYSNGSGSGHLLHRSRPSHVDDFTSGNYGIADRGSVIATIGDTYEGGAW